MYKLANRPSICEMYYISTGAHSDLLSSTHVAQVPATFDEIDNPKRRQSGRTFQHRVRGHTPPTSSTSSSASFSNIADQGSCLGNELSRSVLRGMCCRDGEVHVAIEMEMALGLASHNVLQGMLSEPHRMSLLVYLANKNDENGFNGLILIASSTQSRPLRSIAVSTTSGSIKGQQCHVSSSLEIKQPSSVPRAHYYYRIIEIQPETPSTRNVLTAIIEIRDTHLPLSLASSRSSALTTTSRTKAQPHHTTRTPSLSFVTITSL